MAKLYFYYSAMNAGKSTVLLQSSYNYQERGMQTILYTPAIDDRYKSGEIHSRIGLKAQAEKFSRDQDLFQSTNQKIKEDSAKIDCILVDEAQFLTKAQVEQLTNITDELNIPVLTYGLRSDYMGEPFEGSLYLLAWAEEITEIKTICHCGRKALMNMRIDQYCKKISSGSQVYIGGNDSYVSTWRLHFKQGDSGPRNN
ncbi:MAG: thymidine kinase [Legionellales bacterium]|nr:thymidine kinase [Legionellales bacterium]